MDLTGILKIYSDSMRSEYDVMFINGGEIFTVVDYHNNRFAVAISPMTSVIGWIENTYGIEDLSELKGKEIRFYKDSMYTLNEEMLIKKEFINKSFKTLNDVKDKTTKEWIVKAICHGKEFKEFAECLDISQFLIDEEREENDNMKINYVKPELEYKNGESYLKLIANIQEGDKKYQADIEGIELEKLSIIKEDGIAKYIQFPLSNYKGEIKFMCFDDNDNKWIDKIEECIIKENDSMKVLEEKLNEIIKHIYLAQGAETKEKVDDDMTNKFKYSTPNVFFRNKEGLEVKLEASDILELTKIMEGRNSVDLYLKIIKMSVHHDNFFTPFDEYEVVFENTLRDDGTKKASHAKENLGIFCLKNRMEIRKSGYPEIHMKFTINNK